MDEVLEIIAPYRSTAADIKHVRERGLCEGTAAAKCLNRDRPFASKYGGVAVCFIA